MEKNNLIQNARKKFFTFFKNKKLKIGLALGGGGTRGFAHLGAIKAFEEHGIKFDMIAGTSAGSLVGALYASGKTYSELLSISENIKEKDIKTSKFFFSPSSSEGLEKVIKDNIDKENIEELKKPFMAVAVDLKSTKEVVITKGPVSKAVAGSCAVPAVFQPVVFDDLLLVDGGLHNTIPASALRLFGCDYVVSVDVNPAREYGTESTKLWEVISCSVRILMVKNAERGYVDSDIVVQPDTKRFRSTKTENYLDMIDEGYRATIDKIPQILRLFAKPARPNIRKKYQNSDVIIR